jgi:hypothetical protein
VPVASRSVLSGRRGLRVLGGDDPYVFKSIHSFTRQQIMDCQPLAEFVSLDATKYIAEYGGMPGFVYGVRSEGSGMTVLSSNLKFMTTVCQSRVSGGQIKFNHGSEEFKDRREDCWEFCVKHHRIKVITDIQIGLAMEYPLILARPEDTTCPVCFDPLTGKVVSCGNHQVCLKCYNLLPQAGGYKIKKCPICRGGYTLDEIEKVDRMNGQIIERPPRLLFDMPGGNSFKEFIYNDALFLHMIKREVKTNFMDYFRTLLMSSLVNFYMSNDDAFISYNFNFTSYAGHSVRGYNPEKDEVGQVVIDYVDAVYDSTESKKIINDIINYFLIPQKNKSQWLVSTSN